MVTSPTILQHSAARSPFHRRSLQALFISLRTKRLSSTAFYAKRRSPFPKVSAGRRTGLPWRVCNPSSPKTLPPRQEMATSMAQQRRTVPRMVCLDRYSHSRHHPPIARPQSNQESRHSSKTSSSSRHCRASFNSTIRASHLRCFLPHPSPRNALPRSQVYDTTQGCRHYCHISFTGSARALSTRSGVGLRRRRMGSYWRSTWTSLLLCWTIRRLAWNHT